MRYLQGIKKTIKTLLKRRKKPEMANIVKMKGGVTKEWLEAIINSKDTHPRVKERAKKLLTQLK